MVGRVEWMGRKAKHDQRPIPTKKPKPLDDSTWFSWGMETCRDLDSYAEGEWGRAAFASAMGCSDDEGERRLRVLTRAGYLDMKVQRSISGDFVRYVWSLRDRSLPRKAE